MSAKKALPKGRRYTVQQREQAVPVDPAERGELDIVDGATLLPALALRSLPAGVTVSPAVETGSTRRIELVTRQNPDTDVALATVVSALRDPSWPDAPTDDAQGRRRASR